jgi:hypothetical protein
MVYSVPLLLVAGAFSFLTELSVVVFLIVFPKRGRLDFRSLPRGVLSRQCVAPTRCIRAAHVYGRVFSPFVYENHACVKTDYYIAHAGVHCRPSR